MASAPTTGRVTGGLHAPDGKQIVTGTVIFTPDAPLYPEGADGPVLDAPTSYDLVEGKLPDVELATAQDITYAVKFRNLRVGTATVSLAPFHLAIPVGGTIRLRDAMPVIPGRGTVIVVDTTTATRAEVAAASAEDSASRAAVDAARAEAAANSTPGGSVPGGPDTVARQAAARAQETADAALTEADLAHSTADDASQVAAAASNTAAGKFTMPAGGLPTSGLAAGPRASLQKADTALQSAPVTTVAGRGGDVALTKGDVGLGQVDNTPDATKPLSVAAATALAGKADLVGGLVPTSQIPPLSLTTSVPVVSEAAMLALTASDVQPGDLAVRADGKGTFMLMAADPSKLASWRALSSATDVVTSVNSQVGAIVLGKGDVGLGNVTNVAPDDLPVSKATASALGGKAAASHTHAAADISDASAVGRNVLSAATAAAARLALGAGTSDLALGTTSTAAKRGDYAPAADDITDSTTVGRNVVTAASQAAARAALGITGTGADGARGETGAAGVGGATLLPAGTTVIPVGLVGVIVRRK